MQQRIAAQRTTAPASLPITVAELKTHLRINDLTDQYEDDLLEAFINAAVVTAERYCRIALINQTWTGKLDRFEDEIILPSPPLVSVTTLKYYDTDGVQQTLASSYYQLDTLSRPGRVLRAYNQSWPTLQGRPQGVEIVWVAGFGTSAAAVPESIKHALKLMCGHWYANRETVNVGNIVNELPWATEALLDQFKIAQVY